MIYGVRQAGKTVIVRACLQAADCDYIEFNLIRQPEIVSVLDGATSVDDLILKLPLYSDPKSGPFPAQDSGRFQMPQQIYNISC